MKFLGRGKEGEPLAQREYRPSYVSEADWEATMQTASLLIDFVREIGKRHPPLVGNYGPAIDQWTKEHPGENLEGVISEAHYENGEQQEDISVIKAKLLLELLPFMRITHTIHGGPIWDLAEIINYQPQRDNNS